MRCIACGRKMLNRGTYYECSNFLCDYEEEAEIGRLGESLKNPALKTVTEVKRQGVLHLAVR